MGAGHHFLRAAGHERHLLVSLDGRVKVLLVLTALGVNLASRGPAGPAVLVAASFLLAFVAGVTPAAFLKRMAVPTLLAAVALVTQIFWVRGGTDVLVLPLFSTDLVVRSEGVHRGLVLGGRILGGTGTLLFLSLTTPLPELMRAARLFRAPAVLVELGIIMYRYLFLLLEEGGRIRNAQRARRGFATLRATLRSSSALGGMLVLRTYERAERSFAAMRCRGYTGSLPALAAERMSLRDWAVLLLGEALLLCLLRLP